MTDEILKNRIRRCWGILIKVLNKKGYNRKILAKEYNCTTRTISDDLALLREIGFPIKYGKSGYSISVSDLKIPPLTLNEEQILSVFVATQLMVLTPLEKRADEALQQMLLELSEETRAFLRNLTDRILIAPGGEWGDTETLLNVYRAVSKCKCIRITYWAQSTQTEEFHKVNPYGIYIRDRARSYLVGYSYPPYDGIRRFKLCRIKKLAFRNLEFEYPKKFSMKKEMEKGFWGGDNEYEVQIRYIPKVARLVMEREPPEVVTAEPDGSVLVTKTVRNLEESFYDVLRYGSEATVLKPEELIEMVRAEVKRMGGNYGMVMS